MGKNILIKSVIYIQSKVFRCIMLFRNVFANMYLVASFVLAASLDEAQEKSRHQRDKRQIIESPNLADY